MSVFWSAVCSQFLLLGMGERRHAAGGGFLHLLLVLAVGVMLIRIIQGRNPLA